MSRLCGYCKHFNNDPLMLEEIFKGINILSSVHGSCRGDAGICALHDRYLLPTHSCPDFEEKDDTASESHCQL
ncbi:MAG: hypothetical protein SWE60_21205 [Thermodesulfobacteriota bacterium]|nr:hypothetical protein [Thermodesulfobacteriota bacterium]